MAAVMQHSCHCTEISMNEYIRLKGGKPLDDRWSKFIAEKERLMKLSKEKADRWPNTLVNLRLLREKARQDRIKKEEVLSLEEPNKLLHGILRANKKLERPHVTTLQSRALLDYVNMERAEQLKVKHDMKEKWKKREMGWHELMLKDTKALIALENDKVKTEYQKRVELGRARKKQVEENHQRFLAAEEQKRKEKLELKAKAEEDLRQEQLQAEQKRQKIARVNKELVELNKELKRKRQEEAEKWKIMDQEIAAYAKKRAARELEYKKEQDVKKAEKTRVKDRMIARMEAQLLEARKQINYKETNEQKAKEAAEDALALQKAQRRQRDWELCDKSRQNQLAWKRQEQKLEREDDHYAFEQSAKIIARINAEEEAKEIAIFNVNKEYANHHLKCKKEKEDEKKGAKQLQIEEDIDAIIQLNQDEEYLRNLKFD
ncbi:unnamed protein product [Sphagnum jensenii]|uniref:Trichohyalin-plectin-homology domain-containing protein n=1 Tax=Sphagnum jensenii TaxID=128206 RepID=A0ABP1ARA7_9BRYO